MAAMEETKITKSWADVADEADASETSISDMKSSSEITTDPQVVDGSDASTSNTKSSDELAMDSLVVDESRDVKGTLSNPDDSSIQVVPSGDTLYKSAKTFEDLNLSAELLKGLYVEMKFERPSKVQEVTLPMILTPPHKNLIAQAHNGSGKTTCFVLGMLSRVDPRLGAPQALCICPTRELAIQNMEVLLKMGKYTGITSELAIPPSKENYVPINKRPPLTAQVIIGTPGTINKWIVAKKLGASCMKILVFDEADHMLADSGFQDDSIKIMKAIVRGKADCQVLLFSATFNECVKGFVKKIVEDLFVRGYNQLFVKKEELSLESVKQYKVHCPDELSKVMVVKDKILDLGEKVGQTIIFVRTREGASMLHKALVSYGFEVTVIQGALTHDDRDKIIKEFKDGLTQVLISTDLLARGFDQSQVNLVVNYDLPVQHGRRSEPDYEVYLHRIGRAGRFGRKGAVFNLLCNEEDEMVMSKIENHFNSPAAEVPSWQSDQDFTLALKTAGLL